MERHISYHGAAADTARCIIKTMFRSSFEKIYVRLGKYRFFARLFEMLRKTPTPAVHWYLILVVALCITIANVSVAWFTFRGATTQETGLFGQTGGGSTISRDALEKALEAYQTRTATFDSLRQNPPTIIDPGR